jgi:hypothetical protein
MNLFRSLAPLALAAVTAGAAAADPLSTPAPSLSLDTAPLALESAPPAPTLLALVPVAGPGGPTGFEVSADRTRYDAIRYRPRYYGSRYRSLGSPVQFHLGFFDLNNGGGGSFVAGLRGGPLVDPHVQLGGMVDWVHRTEDRTTIGGTPYVQGSTTITPERVLSRATTNLFPMNLFLQVSGDENMPVIPYGGISGGYEVVLISADDFTTGASFDGTFGGWGWQAWLGAGLPLSGQTRLTGEIFVNQSEPEREVKDASGITFRERVNQDGVGMRFGLAWGF